MSCNDVCVGVTCPEQQPYIAGYGTPGTPDNCGQAGPGTCLVLVVMVMGMVMVMAMVMILIMTMVMVMETIITDHGNGHGDGGNPLQMTMM